MSSGKSFDFVSFVAANVGRHVSSFDYLHIIYKDYDLDTDFIFYFFKLFWPDFKVIEGFVYLSESFDPERYKSLLGEGRSPREVQFWMNLLEITGLFDGLSTNDAMTIAEALAVSWNSKMTADFGSVSIPAKAIRDDDTGEVFVTIGAIE